MLHIQYDSTFFGFVIVCFATLIFSVLVFVPASINAQTWIALFLFLCRNPDDDELCGTRPATTKGQPGNYPARNFKKTCVCLLGTTTS